MKSKRIQIGGALLLAGTLAIAGLKLPSAYAALPVDLKQKGSIEFQLSKNVYQTTQSEEDGEDGGAAVQPENFDSELKDLELSINLYQVAGIKESGAYTSTSDFISMQADLTAVNASTTAEQWTTMAETAEGIVASKDLSESKAAAKDSGAESVTVSDLDLGLYLVTVENVVTPNYIYSFNPYLISVPNHYYYTDSNQDDTWVYSLTGDNAVGLKPECTNRLGDLTIIKNLTGYNASLGGANFIYNVTVEALDGTTTSNVYKLSFDKAGTNSLTITDLPAGAAVTVTEVYTGSSYSLTTDKTQTTTITANPNSDAKVMGEENSGNQDSSYTPESVSFTNNYDKRQNGGSTVVNTFYKDGDTIQWKNDIPSAAEVN